MSTTPETIIEVRDAYKRFDPKTVLCKGLNITVEKGTIYALLGPSGCGKTTLLSCILGRKYLDSGNIKLGIDTKSQVGYMPQDISLVEEITIKETLIYYRWIYNMSEDQLEEIKTKLFKYLDIPPELRRIKELSGGQKRRVSLCVALLHNPQLLILDEPTVGVDPIISYSIWQYLLEISREQNKTILLTTHYIEEARQSNKVGLMRGGILVAEGEPESIICHYGCGSLEEVFIHLSKKQEMESNDIEEKEKNYPKLPKQRPKLPLEDERLFSLSSFVGFFLKNMFFLKRSAIGWFLTFFIPLSTCIMCQYSVGRPFDSLKMGIVNEELLHGPANCNGFSNGTCFPASCGYISLLRERNIDLIMYNDIESARMNAERNYIWGFIHFSKNFTDSFYERMTNTDVSGIDIEQSEIKIWMDMSNMIIRSSLKNDVSEAYFNYLEKLSSNCDWPIHHAKLPIQNIPIYGLAQSGLGDFTISGILILLEFFLPVFFVIPILQDKREKIIERSLISGITYFEILAAYFTVAMMMFVVQTFCNLMLIYGIYGHIFEGNGILALALLVLVGISGMCFGLSFSLLFDSDMTVAQAINGVLVFLTFVSGIYWPVEGLSYIIKPFTWLFPLNYALRAFRSITVRSWDLSHPMVYKGFVSVAIWIVIYMFSAFALIKIKKRMGSL